MGLSENKSISFVCKRTRARGPRHLPPKTILRQLAQAAAARPRHDDPKSQAGENRRHKVDQARAWRPRDAAGRASPACSGMPAQMGPGRAGSIGRWRPGRWHFGRAESAGNFRRVAVPEWAGSLRLGPGPGVRAGASPGSRHWHGPAPEPQGRLDASFRHTERRGARSVRARWHQ